MITVLRLSANSVTHLTCPPAVVWNSAESLALHLPRSMQIMDARVEQNLRKYKKAKWCHSRNAKMRSTDLSSTMVIKASLSCHIWQICIQFDFFDTMYHYMEWLLNSLIHHVTFSLFRWVMEKVIILWWIGTKRIIKLPCIKRYDLPLHHIYIFSEHTRKHC